MLSWARIGHAGSFGALLVGWLMVVYLARHLFTLSYLGGEACCIVTWSDAKLQEGSRGVPGKPFNLFDSDVKGNPSALIIQMSIVLVDCCLFSSFIHHRLLWKGMRFDLLCGKIWKWWGWATGPDWRRSLRRRRSLRWRSWSRWRRRWMRWRWTRVWWTFSSWAKQRKVGHPGRQSSITVCFDQTTVISSLKRKRNYHLHL